MPEPSSRPPATAAAAAAAWRAATRAERSPTLDPLALLRAPCCGRRVVASQLYVLSDDARDDECDSCITQSITAGRRTREAFVRACGAPDAHAAHARTRDTADREARRRVQGGAQ